MPWLFFALICVTLFMASFLIALLTLILGVVSYLLLSIKNKWISYSCIAILIGIGVYFMYSEKLQELLLELANVINNELLEKRLLAIAGYLETGSVEGAGVRFEIYALSINEILNHPILGAIPWNSDVKLSGHSTNLDIWAGCGGIIFAFYLKFIFNIVKENLKNKGRIEKSAVVAMVITFMFASTFNPIFSSSAIMILFVLGPKIFLKKIKD